MPRAARRPASTRRMTLRSDRARIRPHFFVGAGFDVVAGDPRDAGT